MKVRCLFLLPSLILTGAQEGVTRDNMRGMSMCVCRATGGGGGGGGGGEGKEGKEVLLLGINGWMGALTGNEDSRLIGVLLLPFLMHVQAKTWQAALCHNGFVCTSSLDSVLALCGVQCIPT